MKKPIIYQVFESFEDNAAKKLQSAYARQWPNHATWSLFDSKSRYRDWKKDVAVLISTNQARLIILGAWDEPFRRALYQPLMKLVN